MHFLAIKGQQCDAFKQLMAESDWPITHQDVGQTELLAYGYVIVWQKSDAQKVILNYADRQGEVQAQLEVTTAAKSEVQDLLSKLAA